MIVLYEIDFWRPNPIRGWIKTTSTSQVSVI